MPIKELFEARHHLKAGIDKTAQAVAVTLGPKGRNVALDRKWGPPILTHDGAAIAEAIDLQNPYQNMGAQLLKEAATKTQHTAGDGTTTTIVLAQALVSEGLKNMAAGANPMLLKRGLEKATMAVAAALKAQTIRICSGTELANVAAGAAKNQEIGELIADVLDKVGQDGAVTIDEGQGMGIEIQYLEGMQFDQGYLSPLFITHLEAMETVLEEPYLLLCDQKINLASDLVPLLEKLVRLSHRNLVVIAAEVGVEALATLVLNQLRGTFNLVAVKAPGFSTHRAAMLEDIAILTGGTVVSEETGRRIESVTLADLGCCDKIIVSKDNTTILGGHGHKAALKARINQIKSELELSNNDDHLQKLQARLAKLSGSVALVKVGAATGVELKEKKQRVEDALKAARAAVEEGIVPGGGIAFLNAICALDGVIVHNPDEAAGVNIVRRALAEPLRIIAGNAGLEGAVILANVRRQQQAENNTRIGYDVVSAQYQDMVLAGIIDPVKVIRGALQNAASIAAMILTVEVLVTPGL